MEARQPLLVVGNSVRYLAQSAARSGYAVTGVDLFSDADTQVACETSIKAKQQNAAGLIQACHEALGFNKTLWIYTAGFEADPDQLQQLNRLGHCLGNKPQTLALLGDPEQLFSLLDELQIEYPMVQFGRPEVMGGWLIKQAGSCGGMGVRLTDSEFPNSSRHYYQRYIPGKICSITFIANGCDLEVLGINQLFTVAPERGDFNYAGAVNHFNPGHDVTSQMRSAALKLTQRLKLRGANSIDFVMINGRVLFLELNARPPATLELYEEWGGIRLHIEACKGVLKKIPRSNRVQGHAIFYARHDLTIKSTDWPVWCSDLPSVESTILKRSPVCGLHAHGKSSAEVCLLLNDRLTLVSRLVDLSTQQVA